MSLDDGVAVARVDASAASVPVTFREALVVWLRIGLLSFGGPAGQIALMHRILVDEKRWIGEERFLHALNYCMLLPGPEAQQLATYIGWLLHKIRGGIVAGSLFVLPGALVILVLSVLYAVFRELPLVQALFFGVKAAVLAVVIEAVFRIGRRALKTPVMYAVAALAFIGIFFFELPFPVIVFVAALAGFLGHRFHPAAFKPVAHHAAGAHAQSVPALDALLDAGLLDHVKPSAARASLIAATCLVLWFGPLLAIAALLGSQSVYLAEGLFFSKMAVVTFGGAYAVLAYVAQQAVEFYAWLSPGEMLDGLGMAETTPGPLILVLEFVGFLAAFRNPGSLDPVLAGMLGALLTIWVTFVPCFLWIFLGAPYVEALRGRQGLNAALSAITAAVVGVVLNLAIWFAVHVAFSEVGERHIAGMRILVPDWSSVNMAAVVLAGAAFVALFGFRQGMLRILGACALLGAVWHYLIG